MPENLHRYHLHREAYHKLHFDVRALEPYVKNNKGKANVPHQHSFYQLLWLTEAGRHYIDYEAIEHDAHSLFFISPDQVHAFCDDSPNQGYLIHFNAFFLEQFFPWSTRRIQRTVFSEVGCNHVVLTPAEKREWRHHLPVMIRDIKKEPPGYKEQSATRLWLILQLLERAKSAKDEIDIAIPGARKQAVDFRQMIYHHLSSNLNIAQYAQILNTNAATLRQATKEVFKKSPIQLVNHYKVLEAKRLLSHQNIAIQDICYELGFNQPTYFTKWFKKSTGLTPKDFRDALH